MMQPSRRKTGPLIAQISIWTVALAILGGIAASLYRRIYYEAAIGAASLVIFCWVQFGFNRRKSRSRLRIPPTMQLCISFLTFTSVFLGRFFALYRTTVWYDKSQHLLYGMFFCAAGLVAFYLMNPPQRLELTVKPAFVGLFAACFSLACCFCWELYEYTNDRLFGTNMQAWKQGPGTWPDRYHGRSDRRPGRRPADRLAGRTLAQAQPDGILPRLYRRVPGGRPALAGTGRSGRPDKSAGPRRQLMGGDHSGRFLRAGLPIAGAILACCLFYYAARILQLDYTTKAWIKMGLFLSLPLLYWLGWRRLSWRQIWRFVVPGRLPWRRLLLALAGGILAILLVNLLIDPICRLFGISAILDEIKARTHTGRQEMIKLMIYIPLVNAFGEELFFRAFCFLELRSQGLPRLAYLFSGILFSLYHLAIFRNWFSPAILFLCLAGLFAAGLLLDRLASRDQSILDAWLLHGLVNVAIVSVGLRFF